MFPLSRSKRHERQQQTCDDETGQTQWNQKTAKIKRKSSIQIGIASSRYEKKSKRNYQPYDYERDD